MGHSPVCHILLQVLCKALITASPPACTSSPGILSIPGDFFFLNDFIAYHEQIKAGGADPPPKTWIWLQKLKELYVGASRLMQDRCNFWVKMSQAGQTSITAWETTARYLVQMRKNSWETNFFSVLTNSSHVFGNIFSIEMDSGSLMTRLSPWLSWSVKPYHLKRLNKQTSCWQPLLLKNSSIILHLRSPTKASQNALKDLETDPVFSGIANNNTFVTCAQLPEKSAATAKKPAISHTFVRRPSEPSDPPVPPPKSQLHRDPVGRHSVWELLYPLRKTTSWSS